MADVIVGKKVDEHSPEVLNEKAHADFLRRIIALEILHPEIQPQKPTPPYKTLLKWIFFIILVGIFVYAIYLYYLYDSGWAVNVPFMGILQK